MIPSAALVDFQTPLFLVWWLMGLRGSTFFFFFGGLWVVGSVIRGGHGWWSRLIDGVCGLLGQRALVDG